MDNITIPEYQRPYKWTRKNVLQMIRDIKAFMKRPEYRVGTIIFHKDESRLNIVDGQQRVITFILIARFLNTQCSLDGEVLPMSNLTTAPFGEEISRGNIVANYQAIAEELNIDEIGREVLNDFKKFFSKNCTVVVVCLKKLDEAFQMFDSQNTRGKALYPTDLLKAFHIREMNPRYVSDEQKLKMVQLWENIDPESINSLFSDYLFKIKSWAYGRDVDNKGFSAEHIDMFKGIQEIRFDDYGMPVVDGNWAKPYIYAKNYIDDFASENLTMTRYGVLEPIEYPYQIDAPVINGELFFKMVDHYYRLCVECGLLEPESVANGEEKCSAVKLVERYASDTRFNYVGNLFNCLLLYFVDRFGDKDIEKCSRRLFEYAYLPRVLMSQVRRWSINKYALGQSGQRASALPALNMFAHIQHSFKASEILGVSFGLHHIEDAEESYQEDLLDRIKALTPGYEADAQQISTSGKKRIATRVARDLLSLSGSDVSTVKAQLIKLGIIEHKNARGARYWSVLWDNSALTGKQTDEWLSKLLEEEGVSQ
jgi:hypothetical protein